LIVSRSPWICVIDWLVFEWWACVASRLVVC
jgi:hypothetical protein